MRRTFRVVAASSLILSAEVSAQTPPDLSWLTGCWVRTTGDRTVEEQWLPLPGGALVGVGQTIRAGKVSDFETMRIFMRNDSLVFLAQPAGQPHAQFTATFDTTEALIFANPAHDFPQRVIYRQGAGDSLLARIEGTIAGEDRGIDFRMGRAACPSVRDGEARIRALDSLWARTYEVHDTARAMQLMHEAAVITTPRTIKSVAEEMNDIRAQPGLVMSYFRTQDTDVRIHDDAALVAGVAEWAFTHRGRRAEVRRGYGAVYRRGGPLGWQVVAIHLSPLPRK